MESIFEFIDATESATKHLFEGMEYYQTLLNKIDTPMFVVDRTESSFPMEEYNKWYDDNKIDIERAEKATSLYIAEVFAQQTLAGSILQIADKAIEVFSKNNIIPIKAATLVKATQLKAIRFCIGPEIRGVPKGLIINAGRNQHTHFNEPKPHPLSQKVFEKLAINNPVLPPGITDSCFDLKNSDYESKAANILHILNWNDYESYKVDMISLLQDHC